MTDRAPRPIVRLSGGRLVPLSAWDSELLSDLPNGAEFDLVLRGKRSKLHNGMYWAQLGLIIKATDAWPTSEKMHDWVKLKLGYTSPIMDNHKRVIGMTIDSTAFENMDQAAFGIFYEKAAALIAAEMGIDLADVVPGWSI